MIGNVDVFFLKVMKIFLDSCSQANIYYLTNCYIIIPSSFPLQSF